MPTFGFSPTFCTFCGPVQSIVICKTIILLTGRDSSEGENHNVDRGGCGLAHLLHWAAHGRLIGPVPSIHTTWTAGLEERGLISIDSLSVHSSAQYLGSVVHSDNHHVPIRALDQTNRDRSHSPTCLHHSTSSKQQAAFGHRRW